MKYYSQAVLSKTFNESFQFEKIDDYIVSTNELELREFLLHLKQPNAVIFVGWIEQWREIGEILTEGATSLSFSDKLKISEHVLFSSFQRFITPLLYQKLHQQAEGENLNETLQYIVLLETDSRVMVEYLIHSKVEMRFNQIHQLQTQKKVTEDQLINGIHDVVNDQIISIYNAFSKRSYAHVIAYVENCFKILESKGCTLRVANWIVKQLQNLRLNPEHLQQLNNYKDGLKSGVYTVENKGNKQKKINFKPIITALSLLIFVGSIVWIIVVKPFSDHVVPTELEIASSFTEFTVEERKMIDSLLKSAEPEFDLSSLTEVESYDAIRELMVDSRPKIYNHKVSDFYEAWEEYLSLDSIKTEAACKGLSKNARSLPEGFSKLKDKKDGKPAMIRNESDFSIQVVVFENNSGGKAYYHELKKNEQLDFQFNVGQSIGVVAGNYAIPFMSSIESLVFCQTNSVTYSSLLTVYSLKSSSLHNYKFLVSGTDIYDFQVVDMYDVLEIQR